MATLEEWQVRRLNLPVSVANVVPANVGEMAAGAQQGKIWGAGIEQHGAQLPAETHTQNTLLNTQTHLSTKYTR